MSTDMICVNLGCGNTTAKGWINCDSSWHAQVARFPLLTELLRKMDLVGPTSWPKDVKYLRLASKFPWRTATVQVIYASHALEHLNKRTVDNFLRESYRVLRKGGFLRLVVPDLYYHAKMYVEGCCDNSSGAERFLEVTNLRIPEDGNFMRLGYNIVQGFPHLHKQMYDGVTLEALVRRYNFQPAGFYEYGVSPNIPNVKDLECRKEGYEGSLYLEAVKPPEES